MAAYIAENKVRMHDTDMAGIVFFANQFRFTHDAWEDLLEQEGHFFQHMFTEADYTFVIVHCEANYTAALHAGDPLEIHVFTEKIGTHAFTIGYDIFREGKSVGTAKTVHCSIGRVSRQKTPIHGELRALLEKYRK